VLDQWPIVGRDKEISAIMRSIADSYGSSPEQGTSKKIGRFPIVMVGKKFWQGLMEWIKRVLVAEKLIHADDLYLINLVDKPEDAVKVIDEFYAKYLLSPNF